MQLCYLIWQMWPSKPVIIIYWDDARGKFKKLIKKIITANYQNRLKLPML